VQNQIIEPEDMALATIPELQKFILVGEGAISSYKAKLKTLEKAEFAESVRKQTLKDGQKCSEAVLLATARLGELIDKLCPSTAGRTKVLPEGINHKQSHYAQEIHRHRDIMHNVIAKAIDKEDIPTRHDVLKAIKHLKREEHIEEQKKEIEKGIEDPEGLFDIIVIDPPWQYGTKYDADGARGACPYPEMSFEELEQIELPAKDDCILWCWTTHQFIYDAIELLEKWDFEYKCILTWDKEKMGIGKWLRLQCEFCLLGVRGTPLWEAKNLRDIISETRREHSRKPDGFYKMIDDNFIGRKLDYFGREKRKGWSVYGAGQNRLSE